MTTNLSTAPLAFSDRLLGKQNRSLAILCGLGFGLQVYVIGSWWAWWQGHSFGGRMFIGIVPIMMIGLSAFLDRILDRKQRMYVWTAAGALLVWNMLFLLQYRLGFISMGDSITWDEYTNGKLRMAGNLFHRLMRLFLSKVEEINF